MNTPSMMKSLGIALVLATGLAGCDLYFGDDNSDSYTVCGSDGEYKCTGNDCEWVSPTCDSTDPQYGCTANTDCAAGCYCDVDSGVCEEGGFCTQDSDCGDGFHCDTDRGSCEPNTTPVCSADNPCPAGSECGADGTCAQTCICENDAGAISSGFGWCDETTNTCRTGTDPAGDCNDAVTCADAMPKCAAGEVALVANGCWTGECREIAACEAAPVCEHLQDEDSCLARNADCDTNYIGHDCHSTDGSSCTSGEANCTCDSFTFAGCATTP